MKSWCFSVRAETTAPNGKHLLIRTTIAKLGRRGEGIAIVDDARVYVPYALPGDSVSIERQGERGTLVGISTASPDRIDPICSWFTNCGGCAVQALAEAPYAAWKRDLLVNALSRAGVAVEVASLVDAHGEGRRRATFHARVEDDGRVRVGFMQARAHTIVPIDACPILDPRLSIALPAARAVAAALARGRKPLDIVVAATDAGVDMDLRGYGKLGDEDRANLSAVAAEFGLARLSNHGVIVLEAQKPFLRIGRTRVELPPGVFLQATRAGEEALATRVVSSMAGTKRVADLFAGIGTFALRLAENAEVVAIDTEGAALASLDRAARATPGLRPVTTQTRDLFGRPLTPDELNRFDGLVLDPPRAGAETQMRAIAASDICNVVSVACDVETFARDAAILTGAGFITQRVDPIDQFRYSAHLEIVASFTRPAKKRQRRLLG